MVPDIEIPENPRSRGVPRTGNLFGAPGAAAFSRRILDLEGFQAMAGERKIHVNAAFSEAAGLVAAGQSLFVTGPAGTGKSELIRLLVENVQTSAAVCAPTGKAALNIGGRTLHRFFELGIGLLRPDGELRRMSKAGKERIRNLGLLVLDEISMVRSDLFEAVNRRMQEVLGNRDPFGGVPVVLVGDPYQLPPVARGREHSALNSIYGSIFFFDTPVWKELSAASVKLDTCYRQENADFYEILSAVRNGNDDDLNDALAELNGSCLCNEAEPFRHEPYVTLTCTGDDKERENMSHLEKLKGGPRTYSGKVVRTGVNEENLSFDFGLPSEREMRSVLGTIDVPSPVELHLKPGACVMFTKNDRDGRWVNGTMGVVAELMDDRIVVQAGDQVHSVVRETWECCEWKEGGRRVTGRYEQYPLMLAWAMTIHKAQGTTLDRACIDLGERGAFAEGQTYVALSRCRTIDGVRIPRPIKRSDVRRNPRVCEFYSGI